MTILSLVYQITPPALWTLLKKGYFLLFPNKGKNQPLVKGWFWCPVCKKKVIRFNPLPIHYNIMSEKYPSVHPAFMGEMMNYHAYSCPHCGATDRNRLYAMFFSSYFDKLKTEKKNIRFLDIAPNQNLTNFIKSYDFIQYRSVDLYMESADDKADITDLHIYDNESFDMLLCSHVLEHVPNDRKAIAELFRVLTKDGLGIIMVPINLGLSEDFEDSTKTSVEDRWKYFGQDDHVRTYSKQGFISKLEQCGFKVNQYGIDHFGMAEFERCGIHPRSVLYVVTK